MKITTTMTGNGASQIPNDRLRLGEKAARLLIEMAGEDAERGGLLDTPKRVSKAYDFLFSGYRRTASEAIGQGIFPAESRGMVAINDVEFYSLCEHHMLPFWGHASVAYFPGKKILGLSKIPRIVDVFARRMQVQERLTQQVCDAIVELIEPRAVYVQIAGQHMCMMMRGVEKNASHTVTEAVAGASNLTEDEKRQLFGAKSPISPDLSKVNLSPWPQ